MSALLGDIANLYRRDVRTIRRWFATGRIKGSYKNAAGKWSLRSNTGTGLASAMRGETNWRARAWLEEVSRHRTSRRRPKVFPPDSDESVAFVFACAVNNILPEELVYGPLTPEASVLVSESEFSAFLTDALRDVVRKHPHRVRLLLAAWTVTRRSQQLTTKSLAAAMQISVATLYRRYPASKIREALHFDVGISIYSPAWARQTPKRRY
jgi:hypothetical protein